MSKIEIGRYSERLRRALGMKGQEIVSGELSPEVSPVIILEDNSAQWQFLQSVRLCSSAMVQNGTVGNETIVKYRNPAASGILATFTWLALTQSQAGQVSMGYSNTPLVDLATAGVTGVRDHRWSSPANPTAIIASRTSAGATTGLTDGLWVVQGAAASDAPAVEFKIPFLVLPGEAIELGIVTAPDTQIKISAAWEERHLPRLENDLT